MADYRTEVPRVLRDFLVYHETIKGHSSTVQPYPLSISSTCGIFSVI